LRKLIRLWRQITALGIDEQAAPYQRRLIRVFNQLNFLGVFVCILRLIHIGLRTPADYPPQTLLVNSLPLFLCIVMQGFMLAKQYLLTTALSFLSMPACIVLLFWYTGDSGIELYLVIYGIYAFIFLNRPTYTLLVYGWLLAGFYLIRTHTPNIAIAGKDAVLNIFNHATAFMLLFVSVYSMRRELKAFGREIKHQKAALQQLHDEVLQQRNELQAQARMMQNQHQQLSGMYSMRNKLISILSHDLKTPVYGLRNLFKNFNHLTNGNQQAVSNLLPLINHELDHTAALMENLLTWSRNQIGEVKPQATPIDLRQLTNEVFTFLKTRATEKEIELVNDVNEPSFAYGDLDMMKTVLRNLVLNAIKFTHTFGSVTVRTENSDRFVNIIVSDTGIGILPEKQALVLGNDFYTTPGTENEQGSGLGLVICKELVLRNGGDIWFDSVPGKGTTFTFCIPYNRQYVQAKML
jgi:two-component system, sensor histidine kinase and response regulator